MELRFFHITQVKIQRPEARFRINSLMQDVDVIVATIAFEWVLINPM